MAKYEFESPDGKVVEIDAPSQEAALKAYKTYAGVQPQGQPTRQAALAELARRELARRQRNAVQTEGGGIKTKEDYDLVRSDLAREFDKPNDKRDIAFMNSAMEQLKGTGGVFDEAPKPQASRISFGDQLKQMPKAVGDVVASMLTNMVNGPAASVAGLGGAINPNDTYMDARARHLQEHPLRAPQTPEGQAMAGGVRQGMENVGIPQALDIAGETIEAVAGPEVRDAVGSAAELATLRSPAKFTPTLPGEVAVANMRRAGFVVPPATPTGMGKYAGTRTERLASGVAGQADIENYISMANQQVTSRWAARAGRLGEDSVTPAGVQRATDAANSAYAAIRGFDVPVQLPLPQYNGILQRIKSLGDNGSPFGGKPDPEILELRKQLLNVQNARVPDFIDKVRELRSDSFANGQAAQNAGGAKLKRLSIAQRRAADILDDALDAFLSDAAKTADDPGTRTLVGKLHENYLEARKQLSTLHVIRDAMNPQSGALDASVIAKASERSKLDPMLQIIADAYSTAPKALRPVEHAARTAASPLSRMDALALGFGGTAAVSGAVTDHPMAALAAMSATMAPLAARLLARGYALRSNTTRALQRNTARTTRGITRSVAAEEALQTDDE